MNGWSNLKFSPFESHHRLKKKAHRRITQIHCSSVCVHVCMSASCVYCHSSQSIKARSGCRQSIWSACLLHTSFVCVCVCVCAAPSLCLLTLPSRHCVYGKICSLSLHPLSHSLISVLLGWSPRPWISYFWRFLLWKGYSPPSSVSLSLSCPLCVTLSFTHTYSGYKTFLSFQFIFQIRSLLLLNQPLKCSHGPHVHMSTWSTCMYMYVHVDHASFFLRTLLSEILSCKGKRMSLDT